MTNTSITATVDQYISENGVTPLGDDDLNFFLNDPGDKCNIFLGFDHAEVFLDSDGKAYSLVIQPYKSAVPQKHVDAWQAFCDAHNLRYRILENGDWHYPGRTLSVEFTHDNSPVWDNLPTYQEFKVARELWFRKNTYIHVGPTFVLDDESSFQF